MMHQYMMQQYMMHQMQMQQSPQSRQLRQAPQPLPPPQTTHTPKEMARKEAEIASSLLNMVEN